MNELTFGLEYQERFKALAKLEKEAKDLKKQEEEIKEELVKAMGENNIKSVDNDFVRIVYVPASESWRVDWKAFELEEPKKYEKIAKTYNKKSYRKAYVKVTAK